MSFNLSQHLEHIPSWGGSISTPGYLFQPATQPQLEALFAMARENGRSIIFRGSGNSYGDASLNEEQIIIDLTRFNRILDWNPELGQITVEPGTTIQQIWQGAIGDGWWPAVVPGTMKPTIGGCLGMNIHGKNAWKAGPIGEYVLEFDILLPTGELKTCSPTRNRELFYAAIGSFGMLGCFTRIQLQLKRIYSGLIKVHEMASQNLDHMMRQFEAEKNHSDYLVGWIDAFGQGDQIGLGRGQIHKASYLAPDEDPNATQTTRLAYQDLPDTLFGLIPKSILWQLMRPFMHQLGVKMINQVKFSLSERNDGKEYYQSHAGFNFLLDYVPNWKKAYGRHGLIQYQSFIPKEAALDAFSTILKRCQWRRTPSYLAVFKKHRPDQFLISHGVDGYSLALDFRITRSNHADLLALTKELDQIVLDANGRFYFAKDSTLTPNTVTQFLTPETIAQFHTLKQEVDPDQLLQSNLWRRLFQPS